MSAEPLLSEWESFYVIVGSSGGALVGVQFVVVALLADVRRRASVDAINAFATPTVVHFGVVLLVSSIMSAPWRSIAPPSIALAACGAAGLLYAVAVIRRARRQHEYTSVWDDWLWYTILPSCAYAVLGVAGLRLRASTPGATVAIGVAALTLLLVGIRNAWDTVTHIVISARSAQMADKD